MMAANYRHIGGGVNRLGRHYSRFSGFWPMAPVVDQSLALRKSQNRESNRRRRVKAISPEKPAERPKPRFGPITGPNGALTLPKLSINVLESRRELQRLVRS